MKKNESQNVAVFSLRTGWGGAELMSVKLAESYKRLGYNVKFYYSFGTKDLLPVDVLSKRIKAPFLFNLQNGDNRSLWEKVYLQIIDIINCIGSFWLILQLKRENDKIDVVHFNKIRGLSPFVFFWAKLLLKAQIYYTAHDYEFLNFNAKYTGKKNILSRIYRSTRKWSLQYVDKVFCPSDYVLATYNSCFPDLESKMILLNNFSSYERLTKRKTYNGGGVFGYLGRLESIKGIKSLSQAFKDSQASKLIIAGDGSLKTYVESIVKIDERFEYRGVVADSYKNKFFADIDFLVVPSEWEEVYGLVVVEAFSAGVPVICSSNGGLPELINHGIDGYVLNQENPITEELSHVINLVSNMSPSRYENLLEAIADSHIRNEVDFRNDLWLVLNEN